MIRPNSERAPLPNGTIRLHRLQLEVNQHPARFRVLVSGRRFGKTELDKKEAADEFGTPGLVWYIAPTYDMARELMWEPMLNFLPRAWLNGSPNETRMEFDTVWGCRFACKSAEHPDRLRGRGPRKIIADEFQDWTDGMQTWQEVLLPSLLTSNGRAIFTGTPKSFNHLHALYVLGQPGGQPDWKSWQFRTADAPHINQAFLARMKAQMDERSYRQEFEASFESMSGRAYYAFSRAVHVTEGLTLERTHPVNISFDFNVQPATAVLWQKVRDEARFWREVYVLHAGGEATAAAAAEAKRWLSTVNWRGPVRLYGDPAGQAANTTGPSDHAVIQAAFRGASWCVPSSAPHVKDRVDAVNTRCLSADGKTHLVIDASCKHLIEDFEQVTMPMVTNPAEKRKHPLLTHISDAAGYGIHYEWPPVSKGGAAEGYAHWL